LDAQCDPNTGDLKTETLSAKTAALVGYPEGVVDHFECGLVGDVGVAKWDTSEVDAGVYKISIIGDAIKPGNKWSNNHFARLGARFVKPFLTPDGEKKLAQLVEDYASKEPQDGVVRWAIDDVVINLTSLRAGPQAGKWIMIVTPASSP
jgi:hypothetical protein